MKIGIIGTDNSRALNFAKIINIDKQFEDTIVTHIFGLDETRNKEVATSANIANIADTPEELINSVDVVFIEFRDGRLHRKYAELALNMGKPTFVDKPLACSVEDAIAIIDLSEKKNIPLISFSTVKYAPQFLDWKNNLQERVGYFFTGTFGCKADPNSPYGGLFFYAVHAVEMMIDVFGTNVEEVYATSQNENIIATVRYKQDFCCSLHLFNNAAEGKYIAGVMGLNDFDIRVISVKGHLQEGLKHILNYFKGKSDIPVTKTGMLANIKILEAINKSLIEHKVIMLN